MPGKRRGSLTLPDGRRKDFRAKTYEEAGRRLRQLTRERDQGVLILTNESLTVAAFLADWLERRRPKLRASTQVRYREQVAHINRALGRVRLSKITAAKIELLYSQLQDAGMSGSTAKLLHVILKSALKDAVRKRILAVNPCEAVEAPKGNTEEIHPLDSGQANAFLLAARGERFEALFILALRTGMRQGELLALKWADVDTERRTLLVRASLRRLKGGGYEFNPTTEVCICC
jgi:integrase